MQCTFPLSIKGGVVSFTIEVDYLTPRSRFASYKRFHAFCVKGVLVLAYLKDTSPAV